MGLFSNFNPFDPGNVFGGDKGDIVNNLLDPLGGFLENAGENPWGLNELHEDTGDWMDDLADSTASLAKSRWDNVRKDPKRMLIAGAMGDGFTAGNPVGTRVNNKLWGREDTPQWDIYGGPTEQDYQDAEDKGLDTSNIRGLNAVGSTIGKGVINYFTGGLGSTVLDAANNWGYERSNEELLKNAAKNYAINYATSSAFDGAGTALSETGGYAEAGGGFVSNADYGGVGNTFNAADAMGVASQYQAPVNATLQAAGTGGLRAGLEGGSVKEGAFEGLRNTGVQQGLGAAMDYFNTSDYQTPVPYGRSNAADQQPSQMDAYFADVTAPQATQERPYGSTPNPQREQALNFDFSGQQAPQQSSNPFEALSGLGSTITTPNGLWPGVTPGNVGNWGRVGTGAYALWRARQMAKMSRPTGAQNAARGNLEALMRDPSSMVNMPGYKAGEQAITRNMAAQGYLGSGNMMAELANYGGGFYNDTLRTMSGLAAPTQDQLQYNRGSTQLTGQGLQSLLYGGVGLLNPKKPGG